MQVSSIHTDNEFLNIRDEWNGLLRRGQSDNIFLTWEWMYTWWNNNQAGASLLIITVRDGDGRLVGIAPLYIKKVSFHGLASLRAVTFLATDEVCSEYMDFIADSEKHEMVVEEVFDYLRENSAAWDCVILSDVMADSASYRHIVGVLDARKAGYFITDEKECPYITLPGSYESYLKGLSKQFRYNLARREKALQTRFGASFSVYDGSEDIDKVIDRLFELHEKRMGKTGWNSDFLRKNLKPFHMDAARAFHENGALRIYSMKIGGETVAMLYGFRYNDKFFYYQAGMNPDYEKQSVGTILMANCIRDCIAKGLKEFDFLRGTEAYKYKWTGTSRKTVNIVLRSGSLKGKAFMSAESIFVRAKNIVSGRTA